MNARDVVDTGLDAQALVAEGTGHLTAGRPAPAAVAFERAVLHLGQLAAVGGSGQRMVLAEAMVGLARSYVMLGRAAEALDLAHHTEEQLRRLTLSPDQTDDLHRIERSCSRVIATALVELGQHEQATDRYQQLIRSFRRVVVLGGGIDDEAELSRVLEEAAICSISLGRTEAAIDSLTGAIRRWRRLCLVDEPPLEHRRRLIHCLRLLADIEADRGRRRESDAMNAEADAVLAGLPTDIPHLDRPRVGLRTGAASTERVRSVYGNPPLSATRRRRSSDASPAGVLPPPSPVGAVQTPQSKG